MSDVQRVTAGRATKRHGMTDDDGADVYEYREYVPADIADKLLAALVRAYKDLEWYDSAGAVTKVMCRIAIQDATKG